MRDRLAALHDAHDGGLGLELPVRGDAGVRGPVLRFRLLGLDLVDLDAVFGMSEGVVDREGVRVVDFFALRVLAQNTVTCTGEGLERAL